MEDAATITFGPPLVELAFPDAILQSVREAWEALMGHDGVTDTQYLVFEDREGVDDDDVFEG